MGRYGGVSVIRTALRAVFYVGVASIVFPFLLLAGGFVVVKMLFLSIFTGDHP